MFPVRHRFSYKHPDGLLSLSLSSKFNLRFGLSAQTSSNTTEMKERFWHRCSFG